MAHCLGCKTEFVPRTGTGHIQISIEFYGQRETLGGPLCSQPCAIAALTEYTYALKGAIVAHQDPEAPNA